MPRKVTSLKKLSPSLFGEGDKGGKFSPQDMDFFSSSLLVCLNILSN